jgi:hypothetical protein
MPSSAPRTPTHSSDGSLGSGGALIDSGGGRFLKGAAPRPGAAFVTQVLPGCFGSMAMTTGWVARVLLGGSRVPKRVMTPCPRRGRTRHDLRTDAENDCACVEAARNQAS